VRSLFWIEIDGVCMWPALRERDLLLCEPLDGITPPLGDVLIAREGSCFVAHRLKRAYGTPGAEHFVLKADLGGADPPRPRSEILGRALLVYRPDSGRSGQALLDVGAPLAAEPELGPLASALLRRVARWHTLANQGLRIQGGAPLEMGNGLA
jgi:hypothetical protein